MHLVPSLREVMEEQCLDKQHEFQDGHALPICLEGLEEDDESLSSTSQFKTSLEKMTERKSTAVSTCKQYIDSQIHINKSPFQWPSCNKLTLRSCIDLDDDLARQCLGFANLKSPHILSIICTPVSPFDIPVNMRSSKYFIDRLKLYGRTRNDNTYSNFLIQYASAFGPRKVIISPSGKWICDSAKGNHKAANLLKGSLLIHLEDQESHLSLESSRLVDSRHTRSAELTGSSSALCYVSSEKAERVWQEKWRSGSNLSDQMFASMKSTRSYQSELSEHATVSKGLLRCIWKNGIPYFLFSMAEDNSEVYIANLLKAKSSNNKGLDCMYLFHTRTSCKKGSYTNNASQLVGKMKVLCCLTFDTNRSKLKETEFVLFGVSDDHCRETQSSTFSYMKGLPKKMVNMFKAHHSNQQKSTSKSGEISPEFENILQEPCLDELDHLSDSVCASLLDNNLQPSFELAAIVIKDHQNVSRKETVVGGWGLKFLEKFVNASADSSFNSSLSLENCHTVEKESARSMSVVVPAGIHGGPVSGTGGPSSLTERWRSNGCCDCGGWDTGCPLTILNRRSISGDEFRHDKSQEDSRTVHLFVQREKQGEPALKMVDMQQGLYTIYFQSNLSPLQSFSIGVAIIHAQTPALCPNL